MNAPLVRRAVARLSPLGFCFLIATLVLAGWPQGCPAAEAVGDPAASTDLFQQQLESGEFAPALAAAQQVEQAPQRDAWLARLAEAQAGAGAGKAAYTTLAHVEDDEARSAAIRSTRETLPTAGARGGSQADFDTLIEMITTTVKPDSWEEVGGPGTVSEFPNGVYVDADGVLQRALRPREAKGLAVARLEALKADANTDSRLASPLRKVSLTRLEKHVQLRGPQGSDRPPRCCTWPASKKFTTCWSIPSRAIWCWPDRPATGKSTTRVGA
jgi:hypothetical protein